MCSPEYLKALDVSDEEKEHLGRIHNDIYKDAEASKVFRKEDGKLYARKEGLKEANAYVGKINAAYGKPVSRMVKETLSKMKLSVNVSSLRTPPQPRLFEQKGADISEPTSTRILDLFQGERTAKVKDLLSDIAKRPDYTGRLADKLYDALKTDPTVKLLSKKEAQDYISEHGIEVPEGFDLNKTSAFYTNATDEIILLDKNNEGVDNTINHEVIHAITHDYLSSDANFAKEFKGLMDEVIKQLTPEEKERFEYELSSPDEFLTGAFTNGRFQELLASRNSINEEGISVWHEFRNWVHDKLSKFLRLDKEQRTLLHDVLEKGANVISDSKNLEIQTEKDASLMQQLTSKELDDLRTELGVHQQEGLTRGAENFFNLLDKQSHRKEFEEIRDYFKQDNTDKFDELRKNIEEVYKKTEKGKKFEEAAIGFGRSLDQLTFLSKKISDIIKSTDWKSMPDHEVLGKLASHTQLLNEWQSLSDNLGQEFKDAPGVLGILNTLDGNIKSAKRVINDPEGPMKNSVLNKLTELLEPTQKMIQAQYEETKGRLTNVLANKAKRGDKEGIKIVQGMLDKATSEYTRLKVERSDILDFLTGLRGDTNGASALLEALINSPDPITAAVTMDLKNHYDAATEAAYRFDIGFQRELKGLLDKLDVSKLSIYDFNKQFTQEEEHASGEKRLELLNQFTGWQGKLESLDNAVDEARLSGDKDALRAARLERSQFAIDYMHQPFDPEVYKRYELFSDKVGESAKQDRDDIFDEINDIRLKQRIGGSEGEDLSEDEERRIEDLLNKYRQLSSLYNLDGTPKTGDEKLKAERQAEYNKQTKKLYEWKEIPGEFQRKRDEFKDALLTKYQPTDPEYQDELADWDRRNTRIVVNQKFYEDRQKILNKLHLLTKFIKEKSNNTKASDFEKGWETILEQTKGFRDQDGQPVGTEISSGKMEKIKDQQTQMEQLKKDIANLSGLSPNENAELQQIWALIKAKVRLTDSQRTRKAQLEQQRKDLGLSPKDKAAFYSLIDELQDLQGRIPTDYYVMQLNEVAAPLGKVYDHYTAIDLLNSLELEDMRKDKTFDDWFTKNHLEVEKWDDNSKQKEKTWERLYPWSRVVPNDPSYMERTKLSDGSFIEGSPALKYYSRDIKSEYLTPKVEGKTVDNRGRWLPRGYDADGKLLAKDDTYINKKYNDLKNSKDTDDQTRLKVLQLYTQKHLDVQSKLPSNSGKLWMEIPRDQKTLSEMVKTGDFTGALQRAGQKIYRALPPVLRISGAASTTDLENSEKTNVKRTRTDILGNILTDIPIKYTGRLDPQQTSLDIPGSITKYNTSVETKAQLQKTIPFVKAIDSILESSKYVDPNRKTQTTQKKYDPETGKYFYVKQERSVPQKGDYVRLDNIRNLQDKYYNGIYKRGVFTKNRGAWDEWAELNVLNPLAKLGSIAIVAADYPRAIWSSISWNMYSLFDGISDRNFSVADFGRAMMDFHTKILPAWIRDADQTLGQKTLYGQMYDLFDSHNELRHLIGHKFSSTTEGTVAHTIWDSFINPTRMVQSQVGSSIMLAMIRNTRVDFKGNKISLIDAYEKGPDGLIRLKEGVDFSHEDFVRLKERIRQAIRETQGNYGNQDATKLEQYGMGQMVMFMHRYAVPLFLDGYQSNRFNINNGTNVGYYRTFAKFMKLSINSMAKRSELLSTMTAPERARFYKGLAFMAAGVLFTKLIAYYQSDRKPSYKIAKVQDWNKTMALLQAYRIVAETSQMTPTGLVDQAGDLAQKPFIVASELQKLRSSVGDVGTDIKASLEKELGLHYLVPQGKKSVDPRFITSSVERQMYHDLYGTDRRSIIDLYKVFGIKSIHPSSQIPYTKASKESNAARLVSAAATADGRAR